MTDCFFKKTRADSFFTKPVISSFCRKTILNFWLSWNILFFALTTKIGTKLKAVLTIWVRQTIRVWKLTFSKEQITFKKFTEIQMSIKQGINIFSLQSSAWSTVRTVFYPKCEDINITSQLYLIHKLQPVISALVTLASLIEYDLPINKSSGEDWFTYILNNGCQSLRPSTAASSNFKVIGFLPLHTGILDCSSLQCIHMSK